MGERFALKRKFQPPSTSRNRASSACWALEHTGIFECVGKVCALDNIRQERAEVHVDGMRFGRW